MAKQQKPQVPPQPSEADRVLAASTPHEAQCVADSIRASALNEVFAYLNKITGVNASHAVESLNHLTPRELEVTQLMLHSYSTAEIAKQLGISSKTLDIHRDHIGKKLGPRGIPRPTRFIVPASLVALLDRQFHFTPPHIPEG